MGILELLQKKIVFFDGGMGSLLQAEGLGPGELPETWNILHPDVIINIQEAYLTAGCDVLTTNTFGANRLKYGADGEFSLEKVVAAAIANAKEAVRRVEEKTGRRGYVALDLGPTGKLLKPMGDLAFEDAVSLYSEVVEIGVREGADLILIETMSDSYELKAAVLGAKEHSDLPVFATVTFDSKGKMLTGGTVKSVVALLEGLGVDVLGVNCGQGPLQMKEIVTEMLAEASVPVLVNPNAGLPRSEHGKTVYDIDSDTFAEAMREFVAMGIRAAGGCCGTTPEHIGKLTALCADMPPIPVTKKEKTIVTSYAQCVEIGKDPVIIGERINPTGKPKLKQALRDHNLDYILQEGVNEQEHGAHILDVNVGLPEIDEVAVMQEAVEALQSVLDLPLQIDTSDPKAMEHAMRVYNGKPMVNSVNGKQEVMNQVFPLVKKYGGVVVALALDEDGIPKTAEGRIAVAKKIYAEAAKYGISKKDIVIDGLCMTISSDEQGAVTTLKTLRGVRDELGGKTILGVSNISFGLPMREYVNASFFTLALQDGLSAAIINPNSEAMMQAYYSYRALAGLDEHCQTYISMYAAQAAALKAAKEAEKQRRSSGQSSTARADGSRQQGEREEAAKSPLFESVVRGLKEKAVQSTKEGLREQEALEIVNEELIPALNEVGKGFEAGTVFLPQLLMSAEAAKAAFEVIKDAMESAGGAQEKQGRIILATVKGDIHDIGKNIVKVLLENYSFEVLDLGKDVPPEVVVETAVRENIRLVGLSALMTTTVPSMEETIRQLRKAAPDVKIMVGGAVLTKEYADTIGADQYCKDAMASVKYAQSVFGE
ncbi:MAG: homocysteine S-methyltransferase family protein [bacterium]|nr:homocysteine S-methyltransferase family protein [bacterium]